MKVFTYASDSLDDNHKLYSNQFKQRNIEIGLLFGNTGGGPVSPEEIEKIAAAPELREFFGDRFMVEPVEGNNVFVTRSENYIPLPDGGNLSENPVILSYQGKLVKYRPRDRYASCYELFKGGGCRECPISGAECQSRITGFSLALDSSKDSHLYVDEDDLREKLKTRKTVIAGYTYFSPVMTKLSTETSGFWPNIRAVEYHDFGSINTWSHLRSEASRKIGVIKRFKKHECSKCPLKSQCYRSRHCDGAFPSEAEMTRLSVKNMQELINRTVKAGILEPWQIWALARHAGQTSQRGRMEIILGGVAKEYAYEKGDVLRPVVYRVKRDVCRQPPVSYYQLAEEFNLPLGPRPREKYWLARHGRTNDLAVALLYQVLCEDTMRKMGHGWGSTHRNTIVRQLTHEGVAVTGSTGSYVSRYDEHKIKDYADLYRVYGDPNGVEQPKTRHLYELKPKPDQNSDTRPTPPTT